MTALWIAAVVAAIGWLCAAGLVGLWLGERGRRITAEASLERVGLRPPAPRGRGGGGGGAPPGPRPETAPYAAMSVEDATHRVQETLGIKDRDRAQAVAQEILGGPDIGM